MGQPFALEPEGPAAGCVFRDRQFDGITERRHPDLAAQHGLIQRDRQVNPQVTAIDFEERVRRNVDGDQEITGGVTGRGVALPLEPDLLTGGDPGRKS